jgi:hypothetical protein
MFEGWFGKGRLAAAARKVELRGDLARAIELFAEAGLPAEAARVMVLRGDAEADPKKRLVHYTQAAATAPPGHAMHDAALRKRALLVIALAGDGTQPHGAAARDDVRGAARDLETIGEHADAAAAYAKVGDAEGEARALAQAGDVEKLEFLLMEQHAKEKDQRRRKEAAAEVEMLVASGRRRDAVTAAEAYARGSAELSPLRDRAEQLRARRAAGPVARVSVRGKPLSLVLGDEVVIGRTEGSLQIASTAVSRRHLAVRREGGELVARDLGSRNGTQLRGLAVAGAVPVGDGLDLRLGKEVPLRLSRSADVPGAIEIELAGSRYLAPLGAATLGVGAWRIEQASDGWLELVTDDAPPALADGVQLVPRATLLVGDAVATARGEDPVLRVLG